jgi:hypothetical protein
LERASECTPINLSSKPPGSRPDNEGLVHTLGKKETTTKEIDCKVEEFLHIAMHLNRAAREEKGLPSAELHWPNAVSDDVKDGHTCDGLDGVPKKKRRKNPHMTSETEEHWHSHTKAIYENSRKLATHVQARSIRTSRQMPDDPLI